VDGLVHGWQGGWLGVRLGGAAACSGRWGRGVMEGLHWIILTLVSQCGQIAETVAKYHVLVTGCRQGVLVTLLNRQGTRVAWLAICWQWSIIQVCTILLFAAATRVWRFYWMLGVTAAGGVVGCCLVEWASVQGWHLRVAMCHQGHIRIRWHEREAALPADIWKFTGLTLWPGSQSASFNQNAHILVPSQLMATHQLMTGVVCRGLVVMTIPESKGVVYSPHYDARCRVSRG
jgi:hypothetical protein